MNHLPVCVWGGRGGTSFNQSNSNVCPPSIRMQIKLWPSYHCERKPVITNSPLCVLCAYITHLDIYNYTTLYWYKYVLHTVHSRKRMMELIISITIWYRIIIASLLGWPYLLLDLTSWWQLYMKWPLLRNRSYVPTHSPLRKHLLFSKCLLVHYTLVNWYG